MGHRLETSRRISGHKQIPDKSQVNGTSKLVDRYEFPFGQPYIDKLHEVRKHSKNDQKWQQGSMSNKGDELVKHMSNLPKYLQRAEYEKSFQEKALNFGVLDWKRLQKWKLNDHMPTRSQQKSHDACLTSQEEKLLESMKNTRVKLRPSQVSLAAAMSYSETNIAMRKDSDKNIASSKADLCSDQFKNDTRSAQNGTSKMKTDNESRFVIPSPKAKRAPWSFSGISQISESIILSSGESVEPEKNRYSYYRELYPFAHSRLTFANESTLPTQTGAKCPRKEKPSLTSLDSFENSQRIDSDIAGKPALKGRHPSPNRRFSFSLGRLSRSFSSKQTSSVPQLSATSTISNHGAVSSFMDNNVREKAISNDGRRCSPLRRFLDPLVRPRASKSPNGSLSSETLKPKNRNEPVTTKTHQQSTFEALLHLTFKDGLPFFKFAANNGNDILAAAVNKLPTTSGRGDDGCLIYSFCKVSEIQKKSGGWVGRVSKGKCSGLGYNIIGMMKVSNSNWDESVVRESILYGVDANRELAAILVRNQIMEHNNIVVILPGGIHGLPREGAPSSLIERWKSGGLCDCGGWDVGCKLQVLTDEKENCDNLDCISLFIQEKKLMFWLSPLKNGLYSVQYDASISLVEAFSMCVAILTNEKLSHILEVHKEEMVISSSSRIHGQGQGPARYVPSPPLSPVARI